MPTLQAIRAVKSAPLPLLRFTDIPHPERAVARGHVVKIRHGVYASAQLWKDLPPWDRYLARVHAAALVYPDAVFCLESAAALLGLPIFGDPGEVHMLVASRGTSRSFAAVRTHRSHPEREIIERSGLRVTSPADTAVDIARLRHNAVGLAVADAALRLEPALSRDALVQVNESRSSKRGRDIARWPLSRCTALSESTLESVSHAAIEWLGFPSPELQVVFRSAADAEDRGDCFWRGADLIGETDGDLKYDGRFGDPRTVMRNQFERDTRLRDRVREITHWGWREATTFAPLRGILTGAGLQQTGPEDSVQLYAMKRLLAPHAPHPVAPDASPRR
ncbi:hypothetical protein PU630_09720 [Microbacterium horticulturae]|uniref:Transcriptional regulator, AbiEi antitoxin, Type IV TA system n=1 Tax=Microbacterium horticulturae TaxID=3028316 RepID=A0ABY8BTN6_9MICO|nr:hypothetical protein [Microbacterium sp. KACC 23027]WEG07540.1 hypothetical protein PU630_09720 [Microbacterium sp. KACC 23027]